MKKKELTWARDAPASQAPTAAVADSHLWFAEVTSAIGGKVRGGRKWREEARGKNCMMRVLQINMDHVT